MHNQSFDIHSRNKLLICICWLLAILGTISASINFGTESLILLLMGIGNIIYTITFFSFYENTTFLGSTLVQVIILMLSST